MKKAVFWKKITMLLLLCTILGTALNAYADTTEDKLNQASSEIDDLQQQKQDKEDELSGLQDYQNGLSEDLQDLDTQLSDISASLDDLQDKLNTQNEKIKENEASLEEMQAKADKQYADMKKRIQYTYENGQDSVWEILLKSKSLVDFLNRTEYVQAISTYDRQMLSSYQQTLADIETEKSTLVAEQTKLEELQGQMQEKEAEVNTLIADKQSKISQTDSAITDTQGAIDDYEAKIAKQKAYEDELEKKKAAEDAARLAEIKKQEAAENLSNVTIVPAAGDEALLAALIECEAGGESYDGMLAVGSVVLNRVASSSFPNTVVGVIYQSGQFSPVASGRFATVLAKGADSTCLQAAKEVLAGKRMIGALYFRTNIGLISGTVIGNHVFY